MKNVLLAAVLAVAPLAAQAAFDGAAPAALNAPLQAGFTIEKRFMAPSGLTGWVLQDPSGQYNVYFTTADGQLMIAGALVNSAGDNLTQRFAELHIPKPDLTALWGKFEKSAWVASGELENPKSVIYAVMDPNCIFCHYLYLALQPYEEAGLQVRWIPVGFLHEDSPNKAAEILLNGEAALDTQQAKYGTEEMPKGIAVTPELQAKLDANQALMREAQITGTPGILYKDAAGNVIKANGMPPLAQLPGITGLPEQPQTNPALDRFK